MVFRPSDIGRVLSACRSDWSDVRVISELHLLQQECGYVGVLPANVYYLAIQANDPSSLGWDPAPNEAEPAEVAVRRLQQDKDRAIINRYVTPPVGVDPSVDTRPCRGLFMGDSGSLAY
eukprot:3491078-Heterocapsa_arctica.AAC.2